MKDLVTSERQKKILDHIRSIGPCPKDTLVVLFDPKKTEKTIKALEGKGYIKHIKIQNTVFCALVESTLFSPEIQETKAWLASRLIKKGGQYVSDNKIKTPNDKEMIIEIYPQKVVLKANNIAFEVHLEDLKLKEDFKDCLREVV